MAGRQGVPAGANAGSFEPLPLAELAAKSARTGGPISAEGRMNAQGQGPGFTPHCDVEVDHETGHVTILRYTAIQDVGRAIHPCYVEGQMQGGVAQGVGWALSEEYIFDRPDRWKTPAISTIGCRWPRRADDRHDHCRGFQPLASIWSARGG